MRVTSTLKIKVNEKDLDRAYEKIKKAKRVEDLFSGNALNIIYHFKFNGEPEEDEADLLEAIIDQSKLVGDTDIKKKAEKILKGGNIDIKLSVPVDDPGDDDDPLSEQEFKRFRNLTLEILESTLDILANS